jgi:hypothetical protein
MDCPAAACCAAALMDIARYSAGHDGHQRLICLCLCHAMQPHMQPVIPPLDPAALQGKPSLGAGVGSPLAPLKVGGSGGEAGQLQAAAGEQASVDAWSD